MQKTVYAKSSMERKIEYRVITRIYEENGIKKVEKIAQNADAAAHVERMGRNINNDVYRTENVRLVPVSEIAEGRVTFPYIDGKRLDQIIREHIDTQQWEKVCEDIEFWQKLIVDVRDKHPFQTSPEFECVFGLLPQLSSCEAAANVNMDMSASNVIKAECFYIVDYEWTFDFDIPLKYIVYRSIMCSEIMDSLPEKVKKKVVDCVNISEEEEQIFRQMENSFQRYITGVSLQELYEMMPVGNYHIAANSGENTLLLEKISPQGRKIISGSDKQKSESEIELELIKNSRSWKMVMFFKRLLRR